MTSREGSRPWQWALDGLTLTLGLISVLSGGVILGVFLLTATALNLIVRLGSLGARSSGWSTGELLDTFGRPILILAFVGFGLAGALAKGWSPVAVAVLAVLCAPLSLTAPLTAQLGLAKHEICAAAWCDQLLGTRHRFPFWRWFVLLMTDERITAVEVGLLGRHRKASAEVRGVRLIALDPEGSRGHLTVDLGGRIYSARVRYKQAATFFRLVDERRDAVSH